MDNRMSQWWQPAPNQSGVMQARIRFLPALGYYHDQRKFAMHHVHMPNSRVKRCPCMYWCDFDKCNVCETVKILAEQDRRQRDYDVQRHFCDSGYYASNVLVLEDIANPANNHQVKWYYYHINLLNSFGVTWNEVSDIAQGRDFVITSSSCDPDSACPGYFDSATPLCQGDSTQCYRVLGQRVPIRGRDLAQLADDAHIDQLTTLMLLVWS